MDQAEQGKNHWGNAGLSPERMTLLRRGFVTNPLIVLLLLALLGALIYSNTFSSSFHFDDTLNIVDNPRIKNLKNFLDISGTRYVSYLSFALNYAAGELNVFGYHLVNLALHITNAFLVYSLVRLLFRTPGLRETDLRSPEYPAWIALATALLFVTHPIQTQAVTYITQRFASMATLFYLLAMVGYLKWRLGTPEARSRFLWYGMAWLATVLAMKTKEISFTLPFMLLMVEMVFFGPLTRARRLSVMPFLLTLLIIPLSRLDLLGGAQGIARQTTMLSRSSYFFTQCRVIVTYLRLLVFPVNQNLDYDYQIFQSFMDPQVFVSFLILLCPLTLALYLLSRSSRPPHNPLLRLMAFGILWFFLALAVESSLMPIQDVIFEHRLYLPSIGFFLSVSTAAAWGVPAQQRKGAWSLLSRQTVPAVCLSLAVLSLSVATYQRNHVWRDPVTFWQDVVSKSPNKARPHLSLGHAYYEAQSRSDEALKEYQKALQLQPNYAEAYNNMGLVYIAQARWKEAIHASQQALALNPAYAPAHNNVGIIYEAQGRLDEALNAYQQAIRLNPDDVRFHHNLGALYHRQGRREEAIQAYQTAITLQPNLAIAHNNLGVVYAELGRVREAIREFQVALQIAPTDVGARTNLGIALSLQGRTTEAREEFRRALQIRPDYEKARQALDSLTH